MTNPCESATHYCETYGFDSEWRQSRLALLGLTAADESLGRRLRDEVLAPNADAIVDAFYAKLLADAEVRRILNGIDLASLKLSQTNYLLHFGIDFTAQTYFEERMRIGLMHAWVGVPLSLYLCAYQILKTEIISHIERDISMLDQYRELCVFVSKIATLDTSLAGEIYHTAQMRHLETSVMRLRDERTQLRYAAGTDALTGLENRASLLPRLAQLLSMAVRTGKPLCVVMSDLDFFKRINDTYGHVVGDQVLRDTAARMRAAVRDFDQLGRYGGEEFIAVLQDTPLTIAVQVAERVRQRVGEDAFDAVNGGLQVTISQGIAESRPGDSVESLVARADAALYTAKQAGRNCVRVADNPDQD